MKCAKKKKKAEERKKKGLDRASIVRDGTVVAVSTNARLWIQRGLNRRRKELTARGSNKEDSHATGSCDDD